MPRGFRAAVRRIRDEEQIFGRSIWTLLASGRTRELLRRETLYSHVTHPFESLDSSTFRTNAGFEVARPWRALEERESVTVFRGTAFIEPQYGWVICSPGHLAETCLIDSPFAPKPLLRDYVRARLAGSRRIRRERTVLHLRSWGEANYWHFLNDLVGGRLRLAELCGIGADIPIVIGQQTYQKPFVRQILDRTAVTSRRFIIQKDEYIQADEIVLFETSRHSRKNIDFALQLLQAAGGDPRRNRNIFLAREPGSGRYIVNMREIERVCQHFGFETVFTERMSLTEQMQLFSQARLVIGIHGGGLTNLMFRRRAPLALLEIFPPTSRGGMPPLFCWMAQTLGFEYDAMIGHGPAEGDYRSPFYLDPDALRSRIRTMLQELDVHAHVSLTAGE